ncbi:ATP-grasp domain-containing protein [Clostridium botulinum]|nr:ATP-grasp domain-containing protein [Clostridium botulinum]
MKEVKILVFPCGSEIGLEIHNALKDIYFIDLIGASSVADHGKFVFENYFEDIPMISDENFISKFNELVEKEKVDFIFPAMDEVMNVLSANRHLLSAKILAPIHETVETCCSKKNTYKVLEGDFFLPKTYTSCEKIEKYPVIIKPDRGYGSRGFMKIEDKETLNYELTHRDYENVICEYLPGDEYTVDCFTDKNGELRYVSSRKRKRIRNGISVNSCLEPQSDMIEKIAYEINKKISMRGAWFFQVKEDSNGEYKLLEVATRIAGTMCVQRACGVNLPLLTVFDALGYEVEINRQFDYVEVDRALSNIYFSNQEFSEVYVDFDDTIIIKDKVNLTLIRFLYQCVNNNVPIYLITKHCKDIRTSLKKYKISEELFDKIITVSKNENKCDLINPHSKAILIDDSFAERKQMCKRHNIKVVGVDNIEMLMDYRK